MVELAGIIILGIGAQWLSWKAKLPAILPLIVLGLLVGPFSTLWSESGEKWLEPIYHAETQVGIFPGPYFFYFVSLAIGVILFEGGLTLKRKEIRNLGPVILRLVSLGSLITFLGGCLAAYFILNLSLSISMLFGALIIVTGPTVIAPILRNLSLNRNLATILKWESIIIDPIGALVAVLVYEYILSSRGALEFTPVALFGFIKVVVVGTAVGLIAGYALYFLVKKNLIPPYLLNVFTLAAVLGVFVLADLFAAESGLLAMVVMGTALGNLDMPKLKDILDFKESLSVLLISILFIILAAHINLEDLYLLLNWRCLLLLVAVVFIIRPLGVWMSTRGDSLIFREKLFISLIGPRGIVAAGIASLFGLHLVEENIPGAEYITPLVFMVVLGTVLLSAVGAYPAAKFLGVLAKRNDGVLIVGAHKAARLIGAFLRDQGRRVVIVDANRSNLKKASEEDIETYQLDIYKEDLLDVFDVKNMQYLMALTASDEVNNYVCETYRHLFADSCRFAIHSLSRTAYDPHDPAIPMAPFNDQLDMLEVTRKNGQVHILHFSDFADLKEKLTLMNNDPEIIPLGIWTRDGQLLPILMASGNINHIENGAILYLGKLHSADSDKSN
ncbi:MAG: sodium:proton antiporter [Saprospiraceae bacterium]|nr:sodium:proton antiporter [Saprospiraceae bacterium]